MSWDACRKTIAELGAGLPERVARRVKMPAVLAPWTPKNRWRIENDLT
jgi:hypothetical protein